MRTITEIDTNLSLITQIKDGIQAQIDLLDGEYYESTIANTGEQIEEWVKMGEKLRVASRVLNQLWHMEEDLKDDLKESDDDGIFYPGHGFHFRCDEECNKCQ